MSRFVSIALVLALATLVGEAASCAAEPSRAEAGRHLFRVGVELVREARWADALRAFEESAAQRPHPITIYNAAACERALGRYARAQARYRQALRMQDEDGARLPEGLRSEAEARLRETSDLRRGADPGTGSAGQRRSSSASWSRTLSADSSVPPAAW